MLNMGVGGGGAAPIRIQGKKYKEQNEAVYGLIYLWER